MFFGLGRGVVCQQLMDEIKFTYALVKYVF